MATPKPSGRQPRKPLSKAAQQRRKDIDKARKHYNRAAERYRKEARNLGGRDAEILEQAAQELEKRSEALKGMNVRKPSTFTQEQKELIKNSAEFLASNNKTDWQRGETLGKLRLSDTVDGHQFYALTEPLWTGAPYEDRLDWIREALGSNPDVIAKYGAAPNANQMIEIIENVTDISIGDETVETSDDVAIMRGINTVVANYG